MISGLVSVTFRKLSVAEVIALVKTADLDVIEWGGDVHVPHGDLGRAEEVGRLTREAGLKSLCYGSYFCLGKSEKEGLSFTSVLDTAAALGAPSIRVWAGKKASAEVDSAFRDNLAEESLAISNQAARYDIKVCYEYHSNTLTDTLASTQLLLEAANHPNLMTLWQPSNGMDSQSAAVTLKQILPKVHHLHVFHWWPNDQVRHPLADGAVNWKLYLDVLRRENLEPPLLLEFVKDDSPEQFFADARTLKSWINS